MKNQVKRSLAIAMTVCFIIFLSTGLAALEPPTEVAKAAEKGLVGFLSPGGFPAGEAGIGDWTEAKIDYGFQVYTVNPDTLINDRESTLHAMLIPTGIWRFVVSNAGHPAALVTVANVDGRWTAVSIGGTGLAKEIHAIATAWNGQKGFEARFIRVFQAKADLMEITKGDDVLGFVPFQSAKVSLRMNSLETRYDRLMYETEIKESLRESVKENLAKDRKGTDFAEEK